MIWLAIAACLVVSFTFSGIEAGLLSVNRVRLRHRVKIRDRAAIRLNRLLATPERMLVTVLLVTNFMNIVAIALTSQELVRWLGVRGYVVTGIVALPVYLIGLELLPKSLFRRFPYRALAALSEPLRIADSLLTPFHLLGRGFSKLFFGGRPPNQQKLFVAREDFKYFTIEGERSGAISPDVRQLIHSIIDFRGMLVKHVMVPIEMVQTIPANAALEDLIERSRESRHERWPVVTASGDVTGVVNVFDLALDARHRGVVETFQRRIVRANANESAYSALKKLRAARATLGLVIDSNGKPLGVVTWEDLIKRLVSKQSRVGTG